ncbi:MAG: CcmD family protein [Deferribacteres bacterium]|nr:CcmD family protein [candidate division KSB1 bacterium]MCB9512022.1 CcmD family protein [Deferribacteres bacterium]
MDSNLNFLFISYMVIWVLIFGYMFSISRRQNSLEKEINQIEATKKQTF